MRDYRVYARILPPTDEEREILSVTVNAPIHNARDASDAAAIFVRYIKEKSEEPRLLVFVVAVTEIVPTRDELMALAEQQEAEERARKIKWATAKRVDNVPGRWQPNPHYRHVH